MLIRTEERGSKCSNSAQNNNVCTDVLVFFFCIKSYFSKQFWEAVRLSHYNL